MLWRNDAKLTGGFGSLFQMPVLLAQDLAAMESIAFSVGTPRDVICISTADFKKLEKPTVASFAQKNASGTPLLRKLVFEIH